MRIQLSDHFTYKRLLKFTFAPMMMLLFTSIYCVVDGFFVSNFAGKTPFSALNLIYPYIQIIGAIGFMLGAGGSAIVGKTLGEGKRKEANEYFSLIFYFTIACGLVFGIGSIPFLPEISRFMGADEEMIPYCVVYGKISLYGIVFFMVQNLFQCLLITAEKPVIGFRVTVLAGITNMFLDWLLVGKLSMGVAGAAYATILSQFVGAIIPVLYFFRQNDSLLRFCKTRWYGKIVWVTLTNGSSEFVNNVSASVVSIIFNWELMRFAGENGVAAYGTIMYVSFIFCALFFGFTTGISPVISFHFGADNKDELKNLFRKGITIMGVMGVLMTILSLLGAKPLSQLYVGYDEELFSMTTHAFTIFSFMFVFMSFNVFGSSLFTALNNGPVSAVMAITRTVVAQILCVLIMAEIWQLEGIWWSVVVAEMVSNLVSLSFILAKRKKYGYI